MEVTPAYRANNQYFGAQGLSPQEMVQILNSQPKSEVQLHLVYFHLTVRSSRTSKVASQRMLTQIFFSRSTKYFTLQGLSRDMKFMEEKLSLSRQEKAGIRGQRPRVVVCFGASSCGLRVLKPNSLPTRRRQQHRWAAEPPANSSEAQSWTTARAPWGL